MKAAKDNGRGDREISLGRREFAGCRPFGFRNIFQNTTAGGDIGMAGFGEDEPAPGALEKPCSKMGFKL